MPLSIGDGIMYLILVLIAALVVFIVWPIENNAADNYLLTYYNHCAVGSERFSNLYEQDTTRPDNIAADATGIPVSSTSGAATCSYTPGADATAYVSEHGEFIVTSTGTAVEVIPGAVWKTPSALQQQYDALSKLLISVVPIITVAGFFILAGFSMMMSRGQAMTAMGGIQTVVLGPIVALILTIVQLLVSPFLMDFASDAYIWVSSDRLTIFDQFGAIVRLVFGFFPVVFNGSLLAWMGLQGYRTYAAFRGGESAGMAYA